LLAGALIALCINTASAKPAFVQAAAPNYVQGNYATPQNQATLAAVTYTAAQAAGNLNAVIVGWGDSTAQIASVTDASGNVYELAIGPTQLSGTASLSIYYAKNIVAAPAGANTVTVRFSTAAAFPGVKILEYSGIDPLNPLDMVVGATGNSTTSDSGPLTTTSALDLLLGASYVQMTATGPGSGFTQRLNPDGDIAEDRLVTATGSYHATAPIDLSGWWVMQMAAFRSAAPTPTPTPTSVNLAWDANAPTNDPNTNTAGYRLHIGRASGSYSQIVDVGSSTATTVSNLSGGHTYYFVVGAYNAAGLEGSYSNEASYAAP
jgi:hypothetical protein